jgi:hypothetical protein
MRNGPRVTKPRNNSLVPIRWMGCRIAVYDFTIPSESGRKVRKNPRPKSGKRRGRRSGIKKNRKRRNVTVAAPDSPIPDGPRRSKFGRTVYLVNRRENYQRRLLSKIKVLNNKRKQASLPEHKQRLRHGCEVLRARWIHLSNKATKDPVPFCRIKLNLLINITEDSWKTMSSGMDYGPNDIVLLRNRKPPAPPVGRRSAPPPQRRIRCCSSFVYARRPVCQKCGTSHYRLFKDESLEQDKPGNSYRENNSSPLQSAVENPLVVKPDLKEMVLSEVAKLVAALPSR